MEKIEESKEETSVFLEGTIKHFIDCPSLPLCLPHPFASHLFLSLLTSVTIKQARQVR